MSEHDVWRAVGVAFWVFMSGALVAVARWLVVRVLPSSAHWWLLAPLSAVTRRLGGPASRGLRAARQSGLRALRRQPRDPAARD